MDERTAMVTIGGVEYEMLLTTRATKQIAGRYGGLENLGEKLMKAENFEMALDEIVWLITLLCNQPILVHNLKHPEDKRPELTAEEVELLTSPMELTDYSQMTEEQQYELGAYVNLMEAATKLLVNPILGLQPKFSEQDFDKVCAVETETFRKYFKDHRNIVISMANLLFTIPLDEKDKKLLAKSLRKNKEFLSSVQMTKKEFGVEDITMIERALTHRYKFRTY